MLSRLHTSCGRIWIDRSRLQSLSLSCSARLLVTALGEWLLIVLTICVGIWFHTWWVTLLTVLFIGTRQHALLTLMHEFSHRQFSRRHVWLNDGVGNLLTAWPMLISVEGFRHDHLNHHRHVRTTHDPSWLATFNKSRYHFPQTPRAVFKNLWLHLIGFYTLQDIKGYWFETKLVGGTSHASRWQLIIFIVSALTTITLLKAWVMIGLYWVLPLLTVIPLLLYMVDVAEHAALPESGGFEFSRSLRLNSVVQWLFAPYGMSFHTEHHLAPAVPVFKLNLLHDELMKNPVYAEKSIVTNGYRGLLKQMIGSAST
jgi:fatty acid desaturase